MNLGERILHACETGDAVALEDAVRAIAREEVASLSALVLRRARDGEPASRSMERNLANDLVEDALQRIFGEALRDFSATPDEPGPA